jgi:hypothetical protein
MDDYIYNDKAQTLLSFDKEHLFARKSLSTNFF